MIVCPLCEHAQAGGLECEVCGRALTDVDLRQAQRGGALEDDAPPLEGFEPTLRGPAVPTAAEAFPDLEPTAAAAVAAPVPALLAELEPTRAAPPDALEPELAPLPDLERTSGPIPEEERTPFPAVVTCRYCGTEGALGERLCSRCGMRLPLPEAFAAVLLEEGLTRCGCGMLVQGSRCRACGARRAS